jgi:hypothetical protein
VPSPKKEARAKEGKRKEQAIELKTVRVFSMSSV